MRKPEVSAYHARLVPNGRRWRLAAEAGSDVWVAGERITTVPLAGPVTALLATRGEAAIRLESAVGQHWATQLAPARPAPATGPAGSGQAITGQVPKGLNVALPDGTGATVPAGGLPQAAAAGAAGCFAINLAASELGLAALPGGTYHIQLYGGPSLTPIGQPAAVTVNGAG